MIASRKRKHLQGLSTEKLEKIIEFFPYRTRGEAIGNNEMISKIFIILHQRKEIDCETAYCFENCSDIT